jgi:hypothetical protein
VEIGPIAGIRPITMIKSSPSPDLSGVFAVELRKQGHDEAPEQRRAARGLEDEEADDSPSVVEDGDPVEDTDADRDSQAGTASRVSFFA